MATIDKEYHNLLTTIIKNGFKYEDPNRKGVYRYQIPNYQIVHNFSDGFPAITTKKLYWRGVVAELLWILKGDTNIKYLVDNGVNIWSSDYKVWRDKCDNLQEGDLGRIYGYQLRNFGGKFDQLKWIIDTLKNNPLATKKTVTFINPNDKDFQALSPCHTGFKVLVETIPINKQKLFKKDESDKGWTVDNDRQKYQFTLQWEQDSVDTFLGR